MKRKPWPTPLPPPANRLNQNGFTHAFVVEFASAADRDFYVNEDKAHHAFVDRWIKSADGIAAKAMVVDFAPGSF